MKLRRMMIGVMATVALVGGAGAAAADITVSPSVDVGGVCVNAVNVDGTQTCPSGTSDGSGGHH
jgi:hypothetical protein